VESEKVPLFFLFMVLECFGAIVFLPADMPHNRKELLKMYRS